MKISLKVALSIAVVSPLLCVAANAFTNIKVVSFSNSSAPEPVTIEVIDGKAHLVDFSSSNSNITGIFVDDPKEFSKSFKVEPVANNPEMITFTGVRGGSSKLTVNIIQTDDQGEQHIQPIKLVKRFTRNTVTRIVDEQSNGLPSVLSRFLPEETSGARAAATAIADEKSNTSQVAALERGYQVASQTDIDPELKTRMGELVQATKNGEDLDRAADNIGLSKSLTRKLIALGR
jgi:hypothetical protein